MNNYYNAPLRKLAFIALLGLGTFAAHAQSLNYGVANASNTTTTYTDLGTTGTAIATPNNDDANSAATPIGFTFTFNGTAFTDFVLNTNGYLKLGTTAPTAPYFAAGAQDFTGSPIQAASQPNLLLPFNVDLLDATGSTAEYRVLTSGTAPNRVTTIQWKNVKDKPQTSTATSTTLIGTQYDNLAFQVKLYETSNRVEFVYNTATAGAGPDTFKYVNIGIKGAGGAPGQLITVTKGSTGAWSTATFLAGDYTTGIGNAHNIRSTVRPDAGRTYRFNPLLANDAALETLYAVGKTPAGSPQVVRALVRNVGTAALANVAVVLSVTGANTYTNAQTIPALAAGSAVIVTFPAYTPATNGTNTITTTLAGDGDASNNSQTYSQQVQSTTYSVADPAQGATGGSVGFTANNGAAAGTGIFAVKYNAASARTLSSINVRIEGAPAAVGKTVYAVALDNAGAILGRTTDYVIQAADAGTYKTFTFTTPVAIPAGDFYAGFAQAAAPAGTAPFFPLGLQTEVPTRTGVFYTTALTGGAPADAASNDLGRFMIEAVTNGGVQSTSAALGRAVAMYPNPSTGVIKLDVRGANAKSNLSVQVINVLGQAVFTSSLKDNFLNEVNLSGLANGIYTVKVQTGNEFTTRQLVLTK